MNPADLSIADASRALDEGALSAVELASACLERIASQDSVLHAFLHVDERQVLADARASDAERRRNGARGPLHGIPIAIKDVIDVEGYPTTAHSKVLAGNIARRDAHVVLRLRGAGAVILGKTALHEFAIGGPTEDLPWPAARNPWNTALHPGGSSSGSAVAIAARMVAGALGTDTAGSVRNPATCCGIVGLKPTHGSIGRSGVFPLAPSLDQIGPMTRTVEDNAILFDALLGVDLDDPGSIGRDIRPWSRRDTLTGVRIGAVRHFHSADAQADPEVVAGFDATVQTLESLGAVVVDACIAPLRDWTVCGRIIEQVEAHSIHRQLLSTRPEDYSALSRAKLMAGAFVSGVDYVDAVRWRHRLTTTVDAALRDVDALLVVSSMCLPCRLDDKAAIKETYERQARLPFNVSGHPALAVPCGFTASGLPLGVQMVGAYGAESVLFMIAEAFERVSRTTLRAPEPA